LEGYEYDPEYLKRFEMEVLRISEKLFELMIREIMRSAKWVMEFTDDPWGARFTVVYHDGVDDYVYDNSVKKMFRAPLERIVPILLRYGDVGIVDYPEKGFRMIVKKDRVIDDLKDRLKEMLRRVVEEGFERALEKWSEKWSELYS
jgi:hypothetical protein